MATETTLPNSTAHIESSEATSTVLHTQFACPQAYKDLVENGPTRGIREKAAWKLGFYYGFRNYEKAVPLFSALAAGDIHGKWSESALRRLKELAERSGDPEYRQQYIDTANRLLTRYHDEMHELARKRVKAALREAKEGNG